MIREVKSFEDFSFSPNDPFSGRILANRTVYSNTSFAQTWLSFPKSMVLFSKKKKTD